MSRRQFPAGSGLHMGTGPDGRQQCRGAAIGRTSHAHPPAGRCRLFRVRVSGGYDDGGAYWGTVNPVYCLRQGAFDWFCNAPYAGFAVGVFDQRYPDANFWIRGLPKGTLRSRIWNALRNPGG